MSVQTNASPAAVPGAPGLPAHARRLWAAVRPHLPALLFLALMACAYWHRIDTWHIDDDEEGYLYAAWRISRGDLPYRDFLTPQLPAFLFPGGLWLAVFGAQAVVLRAWSAVLMLVAGYATYLTGRRLFSPAAGLAALAVVLLSDDLFPLARAWRPEATMMALAALALYAFVRADEMGRRRGYGLAGLLFGAALLAKLFGALPWAGVALYLVADAATRGRPLRRAVGDLAAVTLPGMALVALVMGGFQLLSAETYQAVLMHHLRQGAGLTPADVVLKTLDFYGRALSWHAPLLAFVPLGSYAAYKVAGRRGLVVPWMLPTVLAFFLLTRTLFARHLVYLLPTLGLLLGAAIAWLGARLDAPARTRILALATIVAAVVLPFVFDDLDGYSREEVGTARLGALVRALAPADTRILADFPGIAFYGGRDTTYSAAGLSEGAAESGQITGAALWEEMQQGDVSLVLIDQETQNGQLKDLVDFEDWQARVQSGYRRLGKFYRQYQPLELYRRKDQPGLGLDFGSLSLEAAPLAASTVPSGGTLGVTAVLHADEKPDRAYTAFLHLVGPDGETWATGDTFMNNALFRGSEEWEPDEVVAVPMTLTVPPGTPPGDYALQLGLYDAGSGERLRWTAPDGASGDARTIAELTVTPPPAPPPAPTGSVLGEAGPFQLLSDTLPATAQAGAPLRVRTTWRAASPPRRDWRLVLRVLDAGGRSLSETVVPPPAGWPIAAWRAGEIGVLASELVLPPLAADGELDVKAIWQDPEAGEGVTPGAAIPLGRVAVAGLGPVQTAVPALSRTLDAQAGKGIRLLGADLPEEAAAGSELPITLAWRGAAAPGPASADTVLVHLVDGAGQVVAQGDGKPVRPVSSWRPGEVIVDRHSLALPASLPAGDYTLLVGLYDARRPDFPRLPVEVDGRPRDDGRIPLGSVRLTVP